ncbi:hemagglutinin [Microbacterium hibisci]|uniref:hemagglutinin n=1 Tax=Microbacterium hibisci TaxID=2036000 RepID=UPI0019406F07|nr:hemagglutinin [Microbacterium hibisci]
MSEKVRRRSLAAGIVGCLVAALIIGSAPAAFAVTVGPYEIEGNPIPDNAGIPTYSDPAGNTKELGPVNSSTTKIGVIHNDALPTLDLTNPNSQVDLNRVWLEAKRVSNEDFLYFAWQRDKETGSGFIAFEFMKNPAPAECAYGSATDAQLMAACNPWKNRAPGDFLILWDQQGGSTKLYVRIWQANMTLSPISELPANTYHAEYSPDGFRGEAAINLTLNGMGSGGSCLAFANVIPSTVTGNSDTADYKDTVLQRISISNCASQTRTTPSDVNGLSLGGTVSIGGGVVAVKDSAEVSVTGGNTNAAGSVAFWLCKVDTGACDGTTGRVGTPIGSTNLNTAAQYPQTILSPTAWVTSVGRYCWRAVFTGDPANQIPGSADFDATRECFTVTPVTPTLSTTASADVTLGNEISDDAELDGTATQPTAAIIETVEPTGLTPAGGTIVFKAYGPLDDDCNGAATYTSNAVTVSGDGTYENSPAFVPTLPGDYHWVAVYSGSSPNTNGLTHNADCLDDAEDVTVTTVASSLTSDQTWVPNDSVTLTAPAGGPMTGTVHIALYPNGDCDHTDDPIYADDLPVPGPGGQTVETDNETAVLESGEYSWEISYTSTNPAQRSIGASCEETSSITILNGGAATSD